MNLTIASRYLMLSTLLFGATGCRVVGDIFKAGLWVGVIVVGGLALLITGAVALMQRR